MQKESDSPANGHGVGTAHNSGDDAAATIIRTAAGTGIPGFCGDGGASVSAQIHAPFGIAADRNGNVFFADTLNHRIRKLTAPLS